MVLSVLSAASSSGVDPKTNSVGGNNVTASMLPRVLCSADDAHPHHAILFFFVALLMGCATLQALSRVAPWMPYTCVLLVEGMLLAAVDYQLSSFKEGCGMGILSKSIAMWRGIDPHLLLFAFLPALLFGDAMALNIHLQEKCLGG